MSVFLRNAIGSLVLPSTVCTDGTNGLLALLAAAYLKAKPGRCSCCFVEAFDRLGLSWVGPWLAPCVSDYWLWAWRFLPLHARTVQESADSMCPLRAIQQHYWLLHRVSYCDWVLTMQKCKLVNRTFYVVGLCIHVQGDPKKPHTMLLSISLLNIDWFS